MNETDIDLGGAADADDPFEKIAPGGFEPAKPGVAEGSLGGVNTSDDPGPEPEPDSEGHRATDVQDELGGAVASFEPTPEERAEAEDGPGEPEVQVAGIDGVTVDDLNAQPDPDAAAEGTSSLSRITDDAEVDRVLDEAGAAEAPEPPQEPPSEPERPEEPSEPADVPQPPAQAASGTLDATRQSRKGGTLSRDYMILERLDLAALVDELCGSKLAPGLVGPIVAELKGIEVIVERTFDDRGNTIDRIRARNGQNALRAAGNMLPLGFEGQLAALSDKTLRFEPVQVAQRGGRAVKVGSS